MYSRNFRPAENRKEGNVPVQFFGDSFSTDAFMKNKNNSDKRENTNTDLNESPIGIDISENAKKAEQPSDASALAEHGPSIADNKSNQMNFDDLLLLGLIFLFLTNTEKKDDIILPVILSAILLSH